MKKFQKRVKNYKRLVVKVGTSTLTNETGRLHLRRIEKLVRVISDLKNNGIEVVLVTSGAVGVGMGRLGIMPKEKTIPVKQASAAVGQCVLMHLYDKLFSEYSYHVAQILLTKDVVEDEYRKQNAMNTFDTLLGMKVIPIVNENDTIAIGELELVDNFGDNDTLSAVVSDLTQADLLVILSDIDGLYDSNPKDNKDAKRIEVIYEIDESIRHLAGGSGSSLGTGGMITKIIAAEIAMNAGTDMIIANGENPEVLYDIFDGNFEGTLFVGKE